MIGIVNYGAGNLKSVKKAFDYLGARNRIVSSAGEISHADRLVLPGVGSFGSALKKLEENGVLAPVAEWLKTDKPFLGICLGLQLLFDSSQESEDATGFGVFKGTCALLQGEKVPQIGWNSIEVKRATKLLHGIDSGTYFYFIHSYYVVPESDEEVLATTEYGGEYASAMGRNNTYAVQFHPEKSGEAGLQILTNWIKQC